MLSLHCSESEEPTAKISLVVEATGMYLLLPGIVERCALPNPSPVFIPALSRRVCLALETAERYGAFHHFPYLRLENPNAIQVINMKKCDAPFFFSAIYVTHESKLVKAVNFNSPLYSIMERKRRRADNLQKGFRRTRRPTTSSATMV